ncbi:hypothetical protein GDO78_020854 [Eleutherodactylus coqui]|uniref:Uncharacterized protein n=1 Tax=Eleutherodactylus coqui TaxID=57060 RepID=A0A8J6BBL2_ELECQ|nr:hypothetical protein GDO78_020854 [Eleutherodactylus coqui]
MKSDPPVDMRPEWSCRLLSGKIPSRTSGYLSDLNIPVLSISRFKCKKKAILCCHPVVRAGTCIGYTHIYAR